MRVGVTTGNINGFDFGALNPQISRAYVRVGVTRMVFFGNLSAQSALCACRCNLKILHRQNFDFPRFALLLGYNLKIYLWVKFENGSAVPFCLAII